MQRLNQLFMLLIPAAILGEILHWPPAVVFFCAAGGVIPMAGLMGRATEELAVHTGPRAGGLLNATLGNAAELIITIVAIQKGATHPELRAGLQELVKASLTGSIIGNLLLILGLSVFLGGLRNGTQRFDRSQASVNSTMLILAVVALVVPSIFGEAINERSHAAVGYLSDGVAVLMILIYALGIVFSFKAVSTDDELEKLDDVEGHHAAWSVKTSLAVLAGTTVAIAALSEALVGAVEHVVKDLGVSEFFLGIILIPLVGNAAEHMVAVGAATKNKIELSLAISLGSSLQIALFVTPLLVFISLLLGNPIDLVFNRFELIALVAATMIAAFIAQDGESNWLEGAQLLVVYAILGIAFFFLPA